MGAWSVHWKAYFPGGIVFDLENFRLAVFVLKIHHLYVLPPDQVTDKQNTVSRLRLTYTLFS